MAVDLIGYCIYRSITHAYSATRSFGFFQPLLASIYRGIPQQLKLEDEQEIANMNTSLDDYTSLTQPVLYMGSM